MKQLCRFIICTLLLSAGIATLSASFWAAMSIHGGWTAADYWFAWFAGISFILGFAVTIIGGVVTGSYLTDLCGGR